MTAGGVRFGGYPAEDYRQDMANTWIEHESTLAFRRRTRSFPNVGELVGTAQLLIVAVLSSPHEIVAAFPDLDHSGIVLLRTGIAILGLIHLVAFVARHQAARQILTLAGTFCWAAFGISLLYRGGVYDHPAMTATAFLFAGSTALCHLKLLSTTRRVS